MIAGPLLGQVLALCSAFCFALTSAFVARTTVRTGDRGVTFSVLVTIVLSAILWLVLERGDISMLSAPGAAWGVFWFALAGLCAMVFGRSLLYLSIRQLGVTRASATKRLNPFFSVALAALVLAEPITRLGGLGLVLIAAAFWLLVRSSLAGAEARALRPVDYAAGIGSALAYAGAYITRKLGLDYMPSPALGTLISALAGLVVFAGMAAVSAVSRANLAGMFRSMDRWTYGAAILMSLGQIAMFTALMYEDVTVIVMIASLEVFLASFLSVVVFRSEDRPTPATYAAALMATAGVVMIAAG